MFFFFGVGTHSICEYGLVIWSWCPYESRHDSKLEKLQQQFLRFLSHALFLFILNLETL